MPTKKMEVAGQQHAAKNITGPFRDITFPGCFVTRHGELLRVPEEALEAGHSPTIDVVSREPWFVTKISDNPYLPLGAARTLAADMDLNINF